MSKKQPTTLRTHLLAMLSAGISYETKQAIDAQAACCYEQAQEKAKRASLLRAALYRVSVHKFAQA